MSKNNGKAKCAALKEIRRQIARSAGIAYDPPQCTHQGDCSGTCPACEAEVRYLEEQLAQRGKRSVAAAAVGGLMVAGLMSSCDRVLVRGKMAPDYQLQGDVPYTEVVSNSMVGSTRQVYVPIQQGDSTDWQPVEVLITSDMVGQDIVSPDSGSAAWRAIEEARLKLQQEADRR